MKVTEITGTHTERKTLARPTKCLKPHVTCMHVAPQAQVIMSQLKSLFITHTVQRRAGSFEKRSSLWSLMSTAAVTYLRAMSVTSISKTSDYG